MIIDGTNLILGRVATYATKKALEGESIVILNCEKLIITGRKKFIIEEYQRKQNIGHPFHGPFYPKMPDRLVRRVIRGMLPFRQERGKNAYNRIKCYLGVPDKYKTHKIETIKEADASKLKTLKFLTVNDMAKYYGKRYS